MEGGRRKAQTGTDNPSSECSRFPVPHYGFRLIIAGGGTGGHLFPGIAVAREFERRFENVEINFVVGQRKVEREILARYGYPVTPIDVEGLKGRGWKKGMAVLIKLPKSLLQSASIVRGLSPALVIGMGGYSAGPLCLSARFLGIPTAIHEQNSYPGLTNRLLSRVVDRVLISFEESRKHFKDRASFLTGNPVRRELLLNHGRDKRESKGFTALVVGGSHGARAINEVFAEAIALLNLRGRYPDVIHQTGERDYGRTGEDYKNRGIAVEIIPFIQDMAQAYDRADLVVSRAGATTIFELAALGKPSILIPYPFAANRHQEINARSLVRAGGAEMILQKDMTAEGMARILVKYMDDRQLLEEMGESASKMGRPDAAELIVDKLVEMLKT